MARYSLFVLKVPLNSNKPNQTTWGNRPNLEHYLEQNRTEQTLFAKSKYSNNEQK